MFLSQRINRPQLNARNLHDRSRLSCLVVAFVMLLAAAVSASHAARLTPPAAQAEARPELVMEVTKRDFGEVFAGEELEQSFGVKDHDTHFI